jgi:hypothetical protein
MVVLYNLLMAVVDITALLVVRWVVRPSPASGERPMGPTAPGSRQENGARRAESDSAQAAEPGAAAQRCETNGKLSDPPRPAAPDTVASVSSPTFGRKLRIGLTVPAIMIVAMAAAGLLAEVMGWEHFGDVLLMAYGIFLHLPLLLAGAALMIWPRWRAGALIAVIALVGLIGVAIDAFVIEPQWLEVTQMEVRSDKLDRPIRVVVIADLQTDKLSEYEKDVFARVRSLEPDLVLLAGDYLQAPWEKRERLMVEFNEYFKKQGLESPLGVFAVQGNIDWPEWERMFAGLSVHTPRKTTSYSVDGIRVTCLSREASFRTTTAVSHPNPNRFHIVIGHSPNYALGRVEADLLLAGHTHGGQVRLPLVGPLSTHTEAPRDWAAGRTELPSGATLIVSRGVGMERAEAPPIRFLCRPQLVVLELLPTEN